MIRFTHIADDNPDLALSPLLRGALLTLDYIETNGPIGLTPLKALKRYFVQWAAEAFAWPFYEPEDLYYLNKVLNEQDFARRRNSGSSTTVCKVVMTSKYTSVAHVSMTHKDAHFTETRRRHSVPGARSRHIGSNPSPSAERCPASPSSR